MSTRKTKDAVDLSTGEKVYYKSHAKATYMSDGRTVEDAIKTAGGGGIAVIDHGTADTTFTLTSGVIHKWGLVDSLTLTVPEDSEGMVSSYRILILAHNAFTLTLSSNVAWVNNESPDFSEDDIWCEINIIGNRALWAIFPYINHKNGYLLYAENELNDYVITDYVISDADYGVECKAAFLDEDNTTLGVVAGARISAPADTGLVVGFYAKSQVKRIDWSGVDYGQEAYELNKIETFKYNGSANTVSNGLPLWLFGTNQNGSLNFGAHMKIYYVKVLGSDGTPNLDLRPYRNEEGVVGFKDLVSGKFYTSVNNTLTGA